MPRTHQSRRLLAALSCVLLLTQAGLAPAMAEPLTVTATPIEAFRKGSSETVFGRLQFLGGFSFSSSAWDLQGVSGLRLTPDGSRFLSVTDRGSWFSGTIQRDDDGRPVGIIEADIRPMIGPDGEALDAKTEADAEGLTLDGSGVLVSFEREARILAYSGFPEVSTAPPRVVPLPVPRHELRTNKGLEAIATSPAGTPLDGAFVTIAENSIDGQGNLFAAIFGGSARDGIFTLRRDPKWQPTDADFLPDGYLLVLERRFEGFFRGLGARLRLIEAETIRPGQIVDGPVVFEADLSEEIDNMEGMSLWRDGDGATRLTLISDDNGSIFQRNLLLEFRWLEP